MHDGEGARANVDRAVLRDVATAATPPPILLLGVLAS
jgi:hypothetical protein